MAKTDIRYRIPAVKSHNILRLDLTSYRWTQIKITVRIRDKVRDLGSRCVCVTKPWTDDRFEELCGYICVLFVTALSRNKGLLVWLFSLRLQMISNGGTSRFLTSMPMSSFCVQFNSHNARSRSLILKTWWSWKGKFPSFSSHIC